MSRIHGIDNWAAKPLVIQDEIMVPSTDEMIAKIKSGEVTGDVYKLLAACEHGIAVEDVTNEQRTDAKSKYWIRLYQGEVSGRREQSKN